MYLFYQYFRNILLLDVLDFFDANCLLNNNQSGFRPNDSSINQLIAITYDAFFLPFLYKLKNSVIDGNLFN